jgi:hypothetical protein
MENRNNQRGWVLVIGILVILALVALAAIWMVWQSVQQAQQAMQPVNEFTSSLGTQVAQVLNPTPTVIPDPVTIVHSVQSLARLETIQYSVEKVITAETGQEPFGFLFGDRLLLVAHGIVIAGLDLGKLTPQDVWIDQGVVSVRLPEPEIFVATLDNQKSYIYDREMGALTHGDVNLETTARQAAEEEIRKAALEDGIMEQARRNGETYLLRLLADLGFSQVVFVAPTPTP